MRSARKALRNETRDCHDRVDAVYSRFRLDTRDGYGAFLTTQAAAHLPCEAALDLAQAEQVVPDWPARRRSAALTEDLLRIELQVETCGAAPLFGSMPSILGAVYVLEGSRLGGAVLACSVPENLPRSFLGASVPGGWRTLMQLLDVRLRSDEDIGQAVAAAREVFGMFEHAAQRI